MKDKNLQKIIDAIKQNMGILKQNYKVKKFKIFGSFARNEQREDSDIDILVEFSESVGLEFFALENYLSEILGIKVDLVTEAALKPVIKENVLNEVIEI